jgi:type IV secretion system protein VirD4
MQTTKKKPSLIFILVGAVLAGYLGYLKWCVGRRDCL